MNFFSTKKAVRQYGEILFIFAIAEMDECTGKDIEEWIFKKFNVKLPSSFIYPTLSKLSGGFEPFIKANPITKTYRVNDMRKLQKLIGPEIEELLHFMNILKDVVE